MKRAAPRPPHSNKKMNTNSNDDRNETDFLFRSPYNPEQQAQAIESFLHSINRDLEYIKTYGFEEFSKRCSKETLDDDESVGEKEEENLGTAFEGTLRDYQIFMLERAKVENTIVHLGTGMGKTLISIMLMKEFLSRRIDGKKEHILFLVPSIALAVQHTDSLRANLPCRVETACHTSSNTAAAREDIANADVVVATHGTAMDLLTHYPDVLSLDKVR
jgi:replicative superfamily II helicase